VLGQEVTTSTPVVLPAQTWKEKLPPIGTLGPFFALLLACLFFATQNDRFLTSENFSLVLQQVMVVGVIAIGQTLIILTAGIDLSCGMVMALGGIVMTKLAVDLGLPGPAWPSCAASAVTALFGLVNGLLVTKHQAAALHRHAGHAEHRVRHHAAVLQRADGDRPAAGHDLAGQHLPNRRHVGGLRRGADAAAVSRRLVLAA
jgi:predicted ABC-type sugar transport system permease subunit